VWWIAFTFAVGAVAACTKTTPGLRPLGDGLDPSSVPSEHRADYALFAQRCSKCHSLSRALDNGHTDDRFWELYVDRMRHQPGSGIAPEDVPAILRFLHFYSAEIAMVSGK
jgi:mono/diheme cytochrome c family protein